MPTALRRFFVALVLSLLTVVPLHGLVITNLISYWSMEAASGDEPDVHGSNDLTDTNTVGSAAGKVGNARDFERDNSEYLVIADNTDVSTGNIDFTICAWVQLESKPASTDMDIVQKTTGSNGEYFLQWRNNDSTDRFAFAVFGSGGFGNFGLVTASSAPTTGVWYHVCGWHDSVNDQLGLDVDGNVTTVAHSAGVIDGTGDFSVSGVEFGNFWDGLIDEKGLWKKVLTSGERAFLRNGTSGTSYTDIQNEGSGGGGGGACTGGLLLRGIGKC